MTIRRAARHKAHVDRTRAELPTADRASALRVRHSRRMLEFSRWFRRRHPLCCDPLGDHAKDGITRGTDNTHHVQPLEARLDLAFVEGNCAPLCTACHAKIEAMERRGVDTESLFRRRNAEE